MLTLILAAPRTGKSQLSVKLGLEHIAEGKRVFVTNFNQTDAQRQQSGFELFNEPNEWWEKLPHGSVWIIDECQDIWPQRGKSTQLPEYIKLLSKHGHHDLTIYVITQDAMQLDVHVRRNCNLTKYMTRPLNMSKAQIYTFRGYQEMPNDAWRRSQVLKTAESKETFKYSSKYQELYTSASAHDHIKKRLPKKLLILPIAAAIVCLLLWFAWSKLKAQSSDMSNPATATVAAAVTGAGAPTAATASSATSAMTTEQYIEHWKERVEGVPHSAPAYDGFQVQDYPRPLCIISGSDDASRCRCYTQQATRLTVPDQLCRSYVLNGVWDPYKPVAQSSQGPVSAVSSSVDASPQHGAGVAIDRQHRSIGSFPENEAYQPNSYSTITPRPGFM